MDASLRTRRGDTNGGLERTKHMSIPTIKLYLDKRRMAEDAPAPIKIAIGHKGKTSYMNTGIRVRPVQWDARAGRVIKHTQRNVMNDLFSLRMNITAKTKRTIFQNETYNFLAFSRGHKKKAFNHRLNDD